MGKYYGMIWTYGNSLAHYGIKGQKWGIRRFQYENGSYTPEGKERYGRLNADGNNELSVFSDARHKENVKIADEAMNARKKVLGDNSITVKSAYKQAYNKYKDDEQRLVDEYQSRYLKNDRINEIEKEKSKVVKEFRLTEAKTRLTSLEFIFKREQKNKERIEALDRVLEKYRKLNKERDLECTRIAKEVFSNLPKDQYIVAMALFGLGGGFESSYNKVRKKDELRYDLRGTDFYY